MIASCRPQKINSEYGEELNPHVKLLNPGSRNSIFYSSIGEDLHFYCSSSFLYIKDSLQDKRWLVSREHLLQLSDTANQRYTILFTSIVAELYMDESVPQCETLLSVFDWGDSLISEFGNKGYGSTKFWEPITTTALLSVHEDPNIDNDKFPNFIKEEFLNSQGVNNRPRLSEAWDDLWGTFRPYTDHRPDILSQLFGLYRIWGHPTIDGIEGSIALRSVACPSHTINKNSVKVITRKWREFFSLSYYAQEKRWPCIDPESIKDDNYLCENLRSGSPIDRMHPCYSLLDWDKVKFDKTFNVPERFELSEMISDKATSLDLGDLALRCREFHDIGLSQDRSVIIRWLRSNFQNPLDVFVDYIKGWIH